VSYLSLKNPWKVWQFLRHLEIRGFWLYQDRISRTHERGQPGLDAPYLIYC